MVLMGKLHLVESITIMLAVLGLALVSFVDDLNSVGPAIRNVQKIYRSADVILMSSRSFAKSIRTNWRGPNQAPEYFPNWAEEVFLHPPDVAAPLPVTFPSGFNIMFAGNLGEAQDFETILNAAELTLDKGVNWLLVGTGRKVQWIEDQVRQRSVTNVFLLGHHPIETMPCFFASADAMLLSLGDNPLFRLTVPAKLQAYMASGKVIIGVLAG
jgi:glycosyltransferase involved in cell wall biosynthesis